MWLFTPDGFYSVVKNDFCKLGELAVRTRSREDLIRFCKIAGINPKKIIKTPEADYHYRVHVKAALWSTYVAAIALNVDYPNFKDKVQTVDPSETRHTAYLRCWSAMSFRMSFNLRN